MISTLKAANSTTYSDITNKVLSDVQKAVTKGDDWANINFTDEWEYLWRHCGGSRAFNEVTFKKELKILLPEAKIKVAVDYGHHGRQMDCWIFINW